MADDLTADQLAAELGLPATVTPAIQSDSLPADADHQVELALFRRAVGGRTTWSEQLDRNGQPVRVERELPADPAACLKWLAARNPDRWSLDGPQLQVSVRVATFSADGSRQLAEGPGVAVGAIVDGKSRVSSGTRPPPVISASGGPPLTALQHSTVMDEGPPVRESAE